MLKENKGLFPLWLFFMHFSSCALANDVACGDARGKSRCDGEHCALMLFSRVLQYTQVSSSTTYKTSPSLVYKTASAAPIQKSYYSVDFALERVASAILAKYLTTMFVLFLIHVFLY